MAVGYGGLYSSTATMEYNISTVDKSHAITYAIHETWSTGSRIRFLVLEKYDI